MLARNGCLTGFARRPAPAYWRQRRLSMSPNQNRSKVRSIDSSNDIARSLSRKLVGQPAAIDAIVPYLQMYRALLAPEGRPAVVFLLFGPTGTCIAKTVESIAEVLHGITN